MTVIVQNLKDKNTETMFNQKVHMYDLSNLQFDPNRFINISVTIVAAYHI